MKEVIGAQGEVTIIKVDKIPSDATKAAVDRTVKGWIISHSESGHHHILTDGEVLERKTAPTGMRVLFAILDKPAAFIQDAAVPHEKFDLDPGIFEFRIAREYDPFSEMARQVAD